MSQSFQLGQDAIYRCSAFQQFPWQAHGFGTRAASPAANVTLKQIHSASVLDARGLTDRQCEGDSLITQDTLLSIGVRTADCVPILLLDSKHKAVAAVHAGWRGTVVGIVRRTLQKMQADFGSEAVNIYAAIGPSIRLCCYEVGPDVADRFAAIFPEWPPVTQKRNLDLPEANRRQLQSEGVPATQVFDSGLCTACCIETFYSYRREPANPGRLLSSITRLS